MYKNRSRGFTLIELLVVIAIIGILSAVVLASLNTARSKGNDAAVQSDLSTIQTQAEIYYGDNGNKYGANVALASGGVSGCNGAGVATTLFVDPGSIVNALVGAENANGSALVVCNVAAAGVAYAVASQLPSTLTGTASYWCVDSTGFAGSRSTALGTATACPAS
ncbi:MAG: type II secretion system protein [Candidatus Paceibacterota bacterium]|jgi:type IV pilus assembly protein PilA